MTSHAPQSVPSLSRLSSAAANPEPRTAAAPPIVRRLQALAGRTLPRMYSPESGLFVFTERLQGGRIVGEGISIRYSAIALLGLNTVAGDATMWPGHDRRRIAGELASRGESTGLGDTALIAWASSAAQAVDALWERLAYLGPTAPGRPTVEVAWVLAALATRQPAGYRALAREIAEHLIASCDPRSALFPHHLGRAGARSHVTCFADQVYPIHALSVYARNSGDSRALAVAARAALRLCERQGADGQWWWHYDVRSGSVIEGYPVYAIHQDAMAPLALRALAAAGGPDLHGHVHKGLDWLASAPELNGGSLIDGEREMVWRKVARREPGKASRYIQAAASRLTGGGRAPIVDSLFPPGAIDYEDRPYHWGWLLYAWAGSDDDGGAGA